MVKLKKRHSSHRKPNGLQRLRLSMQSFREAPKEILTNIYATLTSVVVMFGSVLADRMGGGYGVVLGLGALIFCFGIWDELRKTTIYEHTAIPLPVVIKIANPAKSENALEALFQIIEADPRYRHHRSHLAQYLTIEDSELMFDYGGDIHNREMLKDFLKITRHNLEQLKARTPKGTTLYLAYIGPASVGILVGTMLGTDDVKIFQYSRSSDSYYEAIHIQDRQLKEEVQTFNRFQVHWPEAKQHNRLTVAIDAAAHKVNLNDESIQHYGDLTYLESRTNGTITADEDWMQYCREMFTVFNLCPTKLRRNSPGLFHAGGPGGGPGLCPAKLLAHYAHQLRQHHQQLQRPDIDE
jgi:hypothetical protein